MKNSLAHLSAPLGAILFLLALLLALLFLPDPLQLPQSGPFARHAPLVLRHAPAPVLRHVRGVGHPPTHP